MHQTLQTIAKEISKNLIKHTVTLERINAPTQKWEITSRRYADSIGIFESRQTAETFITNHDDPEDLILAPYRELKWKLTDTLTDEVKFYKSLSYAKKAIKKSDTDLSTQEQANVITLLEIYK